ncbi:hypothetical protein [Bacillus sp. OTU530]|uniref:hypothetical protein n=1 Tax=Bacillus sp. OTU530 TaxID=3043862 RepID=UPI00313F1B11
MQQTIHIPDHVPLNQELCHLVILQEAVLLFRNQPDVIQAWERYVHGIVGGEKHPNVSRSFQILYDLITGSLREQNQKLTKHNIYHIFYSYNQQLTTILHEYIVEEFNRNSDERSMNDMMIHQAREQRGIITSMDYKYHLMRNILTNPQKFSPHEGEEGVYEARVEDAGGALQLLARIKEQDDLTNMGWTEEEQVQWNQLRSAFSSMDEMTADVFDILCFLFLFAPRDTDGFLFLHSQDVLKLRTNVVDHNTNKLKIKERDRFQIMSRVKAIANIWISLNEGEIIEIEDEEGEGMQTLKLRDLEKLVEIGKIRAAYDTKDRFVGIQACQIKPTPLLTSFLEQNKRLGFIDLSALEFHPIREKFEKRLTRYLAIQWFIRLSKRNMRQPFLVGTLAREMEMENSRHRGTELVDRFMKVLYNLQEHSIIKEWNFVEELDYDKIGTKGWKQYFFSQKIIVIPTEEIVRKNKAKLSILKEQHQFDSSGFERTLDSVLSKQEHVLAAYSAPQADREPHYTDMLTKAVQTESVTNSLKEPQQRQPVITEEMLEPNMVVKEMERRKISLLKASEEIEIGYNTLKRFVNNATKRRNKNNDAKIVRWLRESWKKTAEE